MDVSPVRTSPYDTCKKCLSSPRVLHYSKITGLFLGVLGSIFIPVPAGMVLAEKYGNSAAANAPSLFLLSGMVLSILSAYTNVFFSGYTQPILESPV